MSFTRKGMTDEHRQSTEFFQCLTDITREMMANDEPVSEYVAERFDALLLVARRIIGNDKDILENMEIMYRVGNEKFRMTFTIEIEDE